MILKVNGGANLAKAIRLLQNLLPSGITDTSIAYLGVGMGGSGSSQVFRGLTRFEDRGFTVLDRLFIDERTMVSDLTHRLLDLAWEDYRVYVLNELPQPYVELLLAYSLKPISSRSSTMSFLDPKKHTPKSFGRADRALDMIQTCLS